MLNSCLDGVPINTVQQGKRNPTGYTEKNGINTASGIVTLFR